MAPARQEGGPWRTLVVLGGVLLTGCFFHPADKLRPQAAFELQCPPEQLSFTPLSGDCGQKLANDYGCTLGVQGCGKRATYLHVPRSGSWIRNN